MMMALPAVAEAKAVDRDRDGLSDKYELKTSRTLPRKADSDKDQLKDGYEVRTSRTSPRRRDTDKDGLSDGTEVHQTKTSPKNRDTDGDLLSDGDEVLRYKTNPLKRDTDGDGVSDRVEIAFGGDPLKPPKGGSPGYIPPTFPPTQPPTNPEPEPEPLPDTVDPQTAITAGPSGTVDTASASFNFTSSEAGSTFRCRLDGGNWANCTSPRNYSNLSNGSHTFRVRATDAAGNSDQSSATRTWTVDVESEPPPPPPPPADTTPPNTTIGSGPSGTVTTTSASFGFSASESGSTFECRLDGGGWGDCDSPKAYANLTDGSHTFDVRATDAAGNTDASPASRTWTVDVPSEPPPPPPPPPADTTPPETTIGSGPSGTLATAAATFTFSSSETGSSFQCRLDGGSWGACTSPKSYASLANGSHTFDVRATDAASNTDASPASRTWTVNVPSEPPPGGAGCDRDATTSTFSSQVSAASAGQVICLAAGSYGTWSGTNKAITIRPQAGASPSIGIRFASGASGFTIDGGRTSFSSSTGLTISGSASINSGASNITIKNTTVATGIQVDGVTNANILFDHNQHANLSADNTTAAIHLSYTASQHSGVTIQRSLFRDMSADGIQAGPAVNILNNEFARVEPAVSSQHTDAIQLYTGCARATGQGSTIRGNYIYDGEQAIGVFDGTCGNLIEHNVVQGFTAHWITLMADRPGSTIQFNTVVGSNGASIACYSKPGAQPSQTIIRNNIAGGITLSGSTPCTPTENRNNMVRSGGGSSNFTGTPTFTGGSNPSTFAGFRLTDTSAGKARATDGTDVGAFGAGFSGGPPTD